MANQQKPNAAEEAYIKASRVETPWKPAKTLEIPEEYKDPNFKYEWELNESAALQRAITEGAEVDTEISKKLPHLERTLQMHSGQTIDGTLIVNGLILIRIPNHIDEAKKKYYTNKSDSKLLGIQAQLEEEARKAGVETYVPK